MTTQQSFEIGFVKRAMEHGLTQKQAEGWMDTVKQYAGQAGNAIQGYAGQAGEALQKLPGQVKNYYNTHDADWRTIGTTAGGALAGGIGGAMSAPGHRLMGGVGGALAGGALGYGGGQVWNQHDQQASHLQANRDGYQQNSQAPMNVAGNQGLDKWKQMLTPQTDKFLPQGQ